MVLDFLAVDNFDFTRKIVKKNLDEKLVKMLGFFVKIEFLDKNLTFRIVCIYERLTSSHVSTLTGSIHLYRSFQILEFQKCSNAFLFAGPKVIRMHLSGAL